nr:hypothetical protein [Tanacetum cinerariifolium]
AGASNIPPGTSTIPAGVSNKGKSPMVEEDIPIQARTFKQMKEDRLGEELQRDEPLGSSFNMSPPGTSVPTAVPTGATVVPAGASNIPPGTSTIPAGVSNKGKSPMVEEDIPIQARTFKQMKEDRLGEELQRGCVMKNKLN